MIAIAILVAIACAAVGYWLATRRQPAPDRHPTRGKTAAPSRKAAGRSQPATPRYGAVEIQVRHAACEPARGLRGQRYLADEAPALPLPGCTAPHCSCAFVKLSDRRTDDRRLDHAGLSASLFLAKNRRDQGGRRDDD